MAYYQNGVLSAPQASSGESQGLLQWPSDTDFSGPVGGDVSDLSLVPELDASTPTYWQAFGPSVGLPEMTSRGEVAPQRRAQAGISTPWLLIGGIAIALYALSNRR